MERSNPSGNCEASGNLGKPILQALLDSSDFSVSVLIRKSSDAVFPPGVLVHKMDFSKSSFLSAFEGQYAIVSAVGAGGFPDQKRITDMVVKGGAKRFPPSEFSSNTLSDIVQELVPVFQGKKEVLDYLKSKEIEGMSWTGITSGLLFDWVRKRYVHTTSLTS
jgi:hypothetical protein